MIGKRLGPYQVIDERDSGGIGVACKARGLRLDHFAALHISTLKGSSFAPMGARLSEGASI